MPRRARRAPRRRARKGNRRSRVPRPMSSMRGQLKPYTYIFNPIPQYLRGLGGGTGTQFEVTNAVVAPRPIANTSVGLVGVASGSGISGFTDLLVGCSHSLQDISNGGIFASLYDAFKINWVKCTVELLSQNTTAVGTQGMQPTLYLYWDQDDPYPANTASGLAGKQGVMIRQFTANKTKFTMKFKPHVGSVLQTTGNGPSPITTYSGGGNIRSGWLNTAQLATAHYATKFAVTDLYNNNPAQSSLPTLRVMFQYSVSFRGPQQNY